MAYAFHPVAIQEGGPDVKSQTPERTGFKVIIPNQHNGLTGPHNTYAIALRGFNLSNVRSTPEIIETTTLDLAWLETYWLNAHRGHGVSLLKGAIDRGSDEGFEIARADIRHPKVLTLLEKLEKLGCIETLALSPLPAVSPVPETQTPTDKLISTARRVPYRLAQDYLGAWEQDNPAAVRDSGLTNATVEGVFRLI